MLFNSHLFIFIFLPLTICLYHLSLYINKKYSLNYVHIIVLSFMSSIFYCNWSSVYFILLICSILFNYITIKSLLNLKFKKYRKIIFINNIIINLSLLIYYKYFFFILKIINSGISLSENFSNNLILPLGISFYTFTQLSFVWEIYKGDKTNINLIKYTLFVNYFPHLIAGPLIHYRNLINQFECVHSTFLKYKFSFVGLIIFTIGLSKKILIADNIAIYANFLFNYVHDNQNPNFLLAWFGSISYSIQLYFDFSGYSDMAVGISLMFGIFLPVNFNNPFKQNSIIDFWQSWHISLTKYIYEYIYTPVTIFLYRSFYNYKHINFIIIIFPTIITMLVAGVWHGANITFVFFGIMHAFYLIINHIYRKIKKVKNINDNYKIFSFIYLVLTLLCVLLGHVMFRSTNVTDAFKIFESMINFSKILKYIHNMNHFNINLLFEIEDQTFDTLHFINIFIISILGIIFLPNTYNMIEKLKLNNNLSIILNLYKIHLFFKKILLISIPFLLFLCVTFMNESNEFLYFQF